jgi:hypothetical protein
MLKEGRPGLSEEQKVDMWRRWRRGESINDIAATLERTRTSIEACLVQQGGMARDNLDENSATIRMRRIPWPGDGRA